MPKETLVFLQWFLGLTLIFELALRGWYGYLGKKAIQSGGTEPARKRSLMNATPILAGAAHYASIALFSLQPQLLEIFQLPLTAVPVLGGCLLVCAGLALLVWGHRGLGDAFRLTAVPREGRVLITHGLYRYIRHPMYLALTVKAVGVALASSNLLVAAISVVFSLGMIVRIPMEERFLANAYGAPWKEHVARTGALFPEVAPAALEEALRPIACLGILIQVAGVTLFAVTMGRGEGNGSCRVGADGD